ncbi:MAG: type 1 glutamine amidotransferase [Oligoflexia bacterium]|nr:type 1 glutamine amidotransferase [Oligoflexia bacterium]
MRILIIDNNMMKDSWGCENFRRYARQVPGATVVVRRAPHDDLPASVDGFDRILVSGSVTSANAQAPWIDRMLEFIRRAVDARKPYLGVCYGHQMLARALGGGDSVRRADRAEFGWTHIEMTGESPILKGLPKKFYTFSSHEDEVASLPRGAQIVARSESCAIQSFSLTDAPAFGIQFHPEKDLAECEQSLIRWKKDFKARDTLHPDKSKVLYSDEVGEIIFRNFFTL